MTIYYFDDSPTIDKVRVTRSAGGRHTAYLHAKDTSNPDALEALKKALTNNYMGWAPVQHDGESVLEVRNIGKDGSKLLQFLANQKAVSGPQRKETNPENQVGFWQKFKANTLRWSGFSYFIGDVGFTTYGWKDAFEENAAGKRKLTSPQNLLAGIFYACGTPFIAIFGTGDKSDVQLRHMSFETLKYLEEKGIKVPEDSSIRSVTHKHNSTLWKKFISKCERYPAEIANSFYGLAGSMIVWDSVKHFLKFRKETAAHATHSKSMFTILMDIGLGCMSIAAAMVSVFVTEERQKPGEPKKTGLAAIGQWIKDKPLRTAGLLLGLATASHAGSTIDSYIKIHKILHDPNSSPESIASAKKDRGALPGRAVFVASNAAAEGLMSVSSKGHGEGVVTDRSLEPSTYAVMADLIQRSPVENRVQILDLVSTHLAKKEHLNLDKNVIRKGILEQTVTINSNPWLGKPAYPLPVPLLEKETQAAPERKTDWQRTVTNNTDLATTAPTL